MTLSLRKPIGQNASPEGFSGYQLFSMLYFWRTFKIKLRPGQYDYEFAKKYYMQLFLFYIFSAAYTQKLGYLIVFTFIGMTHIS